LSEVFFCQEKETKRRVKGTLVDRVRLENVYNKIFHLVEWEQENERIPIASKAKSRLSVTLR